MTKFQSIVTIVFALSIFSLATAGQIKIGVFILMLALFISIITVMYSVLISNRKEGTSIRWID